MASRISPITEDNNWQTTKNTVLERNCFMFNNEFLSDVRFIVGETKDSMRTFPAHKYVLITSSPVFFPMFNGGFAEQSEGIKITDSEPEAFEEFLRFLYTDQAHLTNSTVVGVLYLAQKYIIPSLKTLCTAFLHDNLCKDNAITVLQTAMQYDEDVLERISWEIIRKQTFAIVLTEEFKNIPYETLKFILKDDELSVSELDLFQAVNRWAEARCLENGQEATGENKRNQLSECLYLIRFPIMSCEEFMANVIPAKILNVSELSDISQTLSDNNHICESFSRTARKYKFTVSRCFRFKGVIGQNTTGWNYGDNKIDGINFSVDKPIIIHGVGLFGSTSYVTEVYSANVKLLEQYSQTEVARSNIISKEYEEDNPNYRGYDVLFKPPVPVQANKKYSVHAIINGPFSHFGDNGKARVIVDGVTFSFTGCSFSANSTDIVCGQIPDILFSK